MIKIYNIFIYFLVFGVALLLFKRASNVRAFNGQYKKWNVYAILAIFILCLFSALRAPTVGTDTSTYLTRYSLALQYDFFSYSMSVWEGKEIGFVGLTYILAHFTNGNIFVFLFVLQMLSTIPIYIAVSKHEEKISFSGAMFCYLLIYYPMSFNIIRQAIAAAFILLSYSELKNNKRYLSLFLLLLSITFHQSAIIGILLILSIIIPDKIKNALVRKIFILGLIMLLIAFVMDVNGIASYFLSGDGFLSTTKLASYFTRYQSGMLGDYLLTIDKFAIREIAFKVLFLVIPLLVTKNHPNKNAMKEYRMFITLSLVINVIVVLLFHSSYGYRITLYLDIMNILYFAHVFYVNSHKGFVVSKGFLATSLLVVCYFLFIYIGISAHDVIPYYIGV